MDLHPLDMESLRRARERAEAEGDDRGLLRLRELEIAAIELPPIIDGARRLRLLCADAVTTTWEAWDHRSGRLLMRCLRPMWRRDPVMLRRMARAQVGPEPPRWHPDGDWPHLRADAPGTLLVDRLPAEDPPDARLLARALGGGLVGLGRLHSAGLVHGGSIGVHLVESAAGVRLVWLDSFAHEGGPVRDLVELARAIALLDPHGQDPVGQLAADWVESPPPSARDGLRLLQRTLATALLDARHHLRMTAHLARRQSGRLRLLHLGHALETGVAPPIGRFCVRAEGGGILVIVESDGLTVRGGASAVPDPRFLPILWVHDRGLDAGAARAVLRAWIKRDAGDEELRAEIQHELGADEAVTAGLMRWLAAQARLRGVLRLLEKT